MAKKSKHPENELVSYLNGSLDEKSGRSVRQHLDSCGECSTFATLVRALKHEALATARSDSGGYAAPESRSVPRAEGPAAPVPTARAAETITNLVASKIDLYSKPELPPPARIVSSESAPAIIESGAHPDSAALASFFYAKSAKNAEPRTAAHIAVCAECASVLGEYARAEKAAAAYHPEANLQRVPESVFKRINEWEESGFGKPKAAEAVLGQATLDRLLVLIKTGAGGIRKAIPKHLTHGSETSVRPNLVPVVVVDRSGNAAGVEMFRRLPVRAGGHSLEHEGGSTRFDGRTLVAVFNANAPRPEVAVSPVQGSSAKFSGGVDEPDVQKTQYFLVGSDRQR